VKRKRQSSHTIPDHASRRIEDARLESYGVIGEIARGGMSTIYLGEHRATGERVAIKALDAFPRRPQRPGAPAARRARARAARPPPRPARHPVRRADAHGVPYLVMEYLDGESLRALSDRRALPRAEVVAIAGQVARALAALHAAGVVHCDIKPDNVFVLGDRDPDGAPRVKVIDFGVARAVHEPRELDAADPPIAGTPAFMAPEQWRGAPVPASDVYSLGAMLYELVTGRPVFSGSLPQLMTAHCEQRPVRPATICSDLAPELDQLIVRMLAKDPALRPSMVEVDAALSQHAAPAPYLQATG